ncbi:MAG: DUF4857 domain-containing protein [Bacteroidales bacterium]
MIKFSKIFLGCTLMVLVLWQLPRGYFFLTAKPAKSPFVLYSPVIDDFVFSYSENKTLIHRDNQGNLYTQAQVDSLLPFFYARQLMTDGRFPDSIQGLPVSYKEAQQDIFFFRSSPRDILKPELGVYQLLESFSGRVKLETPPDVFRITRTGIQFIDAEKNKLNAEKSSLFTELMIRKGFVFPATYIQGNPSVKKEYDEGYLLLDGKSQLFHLKQMRGRPYLRKIDLPEALHPRHLFITEFRNKRTIGFLTDQNHHFYAIAMPGYHIRKIDIPAFNPEKSALMIYGTPFHWTVKHAADEGTGYFALDSDTYDLIKTYREPHSGQSVLEHIGEYISKVQLDFTDPSDKFVYPRIGR